ncbi:hypothetical protein [Flavobacterium aestivum]|uniref:hypothetical protein n=1 Tax=Flavobacterium aestivum TaxID=3003257 RepID=UPI00228613CA|nr:hypothetical protein [Flavobacterium aestivum]
MFKNIDELIDVNLKLLYTSKSQFMMRINFKDEFGYNLKNTKKFSEILDSKGLVRLESSQGFRCDLTDFGRHVFENGGWMKYISTIQSYTKFNPVADMNSEVEKIKQLFHKKLIITSLVVLVLCFLITLLTIGLLKGF